MRMREMSAWTVAGVLASLAASSASGQLVVPPGPPPAETPKVAPPPPPPPPSPSRAAVQADPELPPVDYKPITPRDADGNAVELTVPQDFVALGHNPWVEVPMLARAASPLQARRLEVEQAIIENLDGVERLTTDEFRNIELVPDDPRSAERLTLLQASLRPFIDLGPLTKPLVESQAIPKRVEQLHSRITNAYQTDLMKRISATRSAGQDMNNGIIQFMSRTSTAEIIYFYDRLVIDAAAGVMGWASELGLDDAARDAVRGALPALQAASPAERAEAARAVLAPLTLDQRKRALQKAQLSRPAPQPTKIPDGTVSFRPITVEERTSAVMAIIEGKAFDWTPFVASASDPADGG